MEMDPHERDSDVGDDSPVSPNEEEMSEGEGDSTREHEDADSCDELRRHGNMLADHGDVLAKLKMQVRDIKEDYESSRHLGFPALGNRSLSAPEGFQLPVPFPFPHPAAAFLPPLAPQPQAPSSGSSHSSEGSASSQHTWSFEEQFKQVRQLYEINDDPKRKEFLDDLFSFMQKRGTPINRLPIMAKSVLDLYELYNLVIARGGLVDVINKKLWQEIIKGLHLPSSITSAAFTLRTQYMKYLYPYECEKRRLSTPAELQAAIDGNRREGRRSSYGQYETAAARSPNPAHQLSPLSLVSQQQQMAARMSAAMSGGLLHNGAHHPSHPQPTGQPPNGGPIPGLAPSEFEARMMEYVKLLNKEIRGAAAPLNGTLNQKCMEALSMSHGDSPPTSAASPLNPLEMSRLTLWNLYNNNQPPAEPQREALNLADPVADPGQQSPQPAKREQPESRESPPPSKKFSRDGEDVSSPRHMSGGTTHIKINSRGDSRTGDSSLVVSMELNGVTYQGVLFAQSSPSSGRTALAL